MFDYGNYVDTESAIFNNVQTNNFILIIILY